MQHNFSNVSFGALHLLICFFTMHANSSNVLKYLLCVHSRRVIFHTLSILFRSGLAHLQLSSPGVLKCRFVFQGAFAGTLFCV